nr:CC/Se motif family (seleno)protein [Caldalkalibacillus salinus]
MSWDQQAREWLSSKGGVLTIKRVQAKGCCGGGPIELMTVIGEPDQPERYEKIQDKQHTVYVEKNIKAKNNELHLKLSGFSLFKNISVSGVERFL